MSATDVFFSLLRHALWGGSYDKPVQRLSHKQYMTLIQLGEEQTVAGHLAQALIDNDVKLDSEDVYDIVSLLQSIKQQNDLLDKATVKICAMMASQGVSMIVVKGQTLAPLYSKPEQRQCGDVDFICKKENLDKAVKYLRDDLDVELNYEGSNKHAGFKMDDVKYEIHRTLTNFAYPAHQRYWEEIIMMEAWQNIYLRTISGTHVPTLHPTYNVIYLLVHIMFHLIVDGIGIRQFCDLAMVLRREGEKIDRNLLEKHLKGIGLLKAFSGVGAVLTDYLGFPEDKFPMIITDKDHRKASSLVKNVFMMGNFGHNVGYRHQKGPLHAIEHAVRMGSQGYRFYSYAPKEVLWRIPYFMRWWGKRMLGYVSLCQNYQKNVFKKN